MKNLRSMFSLMLFVVAIGFSACAEDPAMDDILNNTEINPASPSSTDGSDDENRPCSNCG